MMSPAITERGRDQAAAFDDDGWLHTGDAGYINDKGHLVVIDRIKDLATTAKGIRFSPQFIENKLKFSPYIAEAVILGAEREHLAAIICIRYSIVSKWAEKQRIAFTTYSDLSSAPGVYDVIRKEVGGQRLLPEAQRIRKFLLLYKELDADDGELTRTRKVRRGVVGEKYADIIDTLYSDRGSVDIDTVIHFQDGSRQRIVTTLKVVDLGVAGRCRADGRGIEGRASVNWELLFQLVLNGIIVGTLYGVVAMCFVLIYKATRGGELRAGRVPAGRRLGLLVADDHFRAGLRAGLHRHPVVHDGLRHPDPGGRPAA